MHCSYNQSLNSVFCIAVSHWVTNSYLFCFLPWMLPLTPLNIIVEKENAESSESNVKLFEGRIVCSFDSSKQMGQTGFSEI